MYEPAESSEEGMPTFTPRQPWTVIFQKKPSLPSEVMHIGGLHIREPAREKIVFRCDCEDCTSFYKSGGGMRFVNPHTKEVKPRTPPPPPFSYMDLVNRIRAAAVDREELRDAKRRAEHEAILVAAAAACVDTVLSAEMEKPLIDELKKNLHQNLKLWRQ